VITFAGLWNLISRTDLLGIRKKSPGRRRNGDCRMPVTHGPTLELARRDLRLLVPGISLIPRESVCRSSLARAPDRAFR